MSADARLVVMRVCPGCQGHAEKRVSRCQPSKAVCEVNSVYAVCENKSIYCYTEIYVVFTFYFSPGVNNNCIGPSSHSEQTLTETPTVCPTSTKVTEQTETK